MNSGFFKRAVGLTILYIGLFVLLVLVQFTREQGLSENFGSFSVRATYPKSVRSKSTTVPESVRLVYAGLSFEISSKSSAESLGVGGTASPLVLSSIERLPNGVRIRLSPGVVLIATADKGAKDRFSLSATAPEGVATVRLRFSPTSARFGDLDGRRGISFGGNSYEISLATGSLDGKGFLSLQAGDQGLSIVRAEPVHAKPPQSESPEKLIVQAPKSAEVFKAEIVAWRDRAWLGLSSLRFDAAKITWKGQDGIPSFSEKALAAYLAESLARGSYQDALLRVRGAKEIWTDKLGFLSAPYFGGLNRKMKDFAAVDLVETKRLAQLLADKSPVALEKDGLLRYLINRSPNDLAQVALRYISVLVPAKLTIKQTVGLLGCAVDAKSLLKDEDNSLRDAAAAADRIVAAVHKSTSGYFLASEEDSSSDIRLSLLAGCILASYGEASSKPALIGVGQSLVESVLGLADAQGFVPARVLARGGAVELKTGILSPEEIYPLFADNPYYPHEVGFIRDAAPGIWAWTCAPSLSVKVSGNRYVFAARFPEGRSHFLSFYGVKPFANIQLYEIDYSPDNDFENYDASGYLYDRTIGALFLKMKHKKESEDIKLSF